MKQKKALALYAMLAGIIIAIDQVSKWWVYHMVDRVYSWGPLSIDLVFNQGVSWGLLQNILQPWMVTMLVVVITAGVVWYAYTQFLQNRCIGGEVLVIAGSVSNLIDRMIYPGVLDFIELSYAGWSWPVFNIADVSIVVGIACIFLAQFHSPR